MPIIILIKVTFTTILRNYNIRKLNCLELYSNLNQNRWKQWENVLYVDMERSPSQIVKWKQRPAQNRIVCIITQKDGKLKHALYSYLLVFAKATCWWKLWVFVSHTQREKQKRTQTGQKDGNGWGEEGLQARFLLHTLFILIPFEHVNILPIWKLD